MITFLWIDPLNNHTIESIEYQFHCALRAYAYKKTCERYI